MVIPLNWKLFVVVFLSSVAGNIVGSLLFERLPAARWEVIKETCPDGHSGREFFVIETLPPFEWKS
jgi:hypothetical protein